MLTDISVLVGSGFLAGMIAGILGIGGGTLLVPLLVTMGYPPKQAIATSSLAICVIATVGSWQNWRTENLDLRKAILLGLPAIFTAHLGVALANYGKPQVLLVGFGLLLLVNIYLVQLRVSLGQKQASADLTRSISAAKTQLFRLLTGGLAGILTGLFGVGGGVILVPLQIVLLQEGIKQAIRTSLGAIVITSTIASLSHTLSGNTLFIPGLSLGVGGLLGVQISTRLLPKMPEEIVKQLFRLFMGISAVYVFFLATQA